MAACRTPAATGLAFWLLSLCGLVALSLSHPAWGSPIAVICTLTGILAIAVLTGKSSRLHGGFLSALLPPLYSGLLALAAIQALMEIYRVPSGLIPTPLEMFHSAWHNRSLLIADSWQTVVLEALSGMTAGVCTGLAIAVLIVRVRFFERGLLPYMVLFASLPMPAMAPLAVAGTGWLSKAILVTIVTIFPTVINTVRGLQSSSPMSLDLLRSYGLEGLGTFPPLRLPAALPYLFTALKIDLTLALISAIVGEFFGSSGSGLGFRIKFNVATFNMPLVWAAILYTTVLGLALYSVIVLLERRLTFWHPSMRQAPNHPSTAEESS